MYVRYIFYHVSLIKFLKYYVANRNVRLVGYYYDICKNEALYLEADQI